MINCWQTEIKKYGFKKICLMIQNSGWFFSPSYNDKYFDYQIKFEPYFSKQYAEKNLQLISFTQKTYRILRCIKIEKVVYKMVKACRMFLSKPQEDRLSIFSYDKECKDIINGPHSIKMIQGFRMLISAASTLMR